MLQVWPHQCWIKGKGNFPPAAGNTPNAAQGIISLCHIAGPFSAWSHQGLFWKKCFPAGQPPIYTGAWGCHQVRTYCFPLLNGVRFLPLHFFSLLRLLWMAAQRSQFCVISRLVEGILWPITQIIKEDVNQGQTLHWPLQYTASTGSQLDFEPLITTLLAWLFSPFSIHVAVHSAHTSSAFLWRS